MNYVLENWGSFVGVLGLAITIVGAIFSIAAFKRAGKAKEAAEAAEIASQETQEGITKVLTIVDMERAIGLITRLKTFHRSNNWGAAIEHYQDLRHMLINIVTRNPGLTDELRSVLREDIIKVAAIEAGVETAVQRDRTPSGLINFNRDLNAIQSRLEEMTSSTQFPRG